MAKKGGAPTKSEVMAQICKDVEFSRKQVADGIGAGRAGCGAGGLSRYFISDGKVGSADRHASRPGYRSGDIPGGLLSVGRRQKNEKDRYRSGPQT